MKILLLKIKSRWNPNDFLKKEENMNVHIVRVNEKIERIANIYNLTKEEIIKINHHIRDWDNLIPGTKLRLPEIPENVELELDNTEPFIEEYYPKIDINEINVKKEYVEIIPSVEEQTEPVNTNVNKPIKKNNKPPYYGNPYGYYGYYGYYQGYNPYGYYRKSKPKNKKTN